MRSSGGNVLTHVARIIEYLADKPAGAGVREIGRDLNIPKSTAHLILTRMKSLRMVDQDPETFMYCLGPLLVQSGMAMVRHRGLRDIVLPLLTRLTHSSPAVGTVNLLDGDGVTCIEVVENRDGIRWSASLGKVYPLHAGAVGKSILAFLPAPSLEFHLSRVGGDVPNQLHESLERVRCTGIAVTRGEKCAGGLAIAAPFWNHHDQVYGCLALLGPETAFASHELLRLAVELRGIANHLSERLGASRRLVASFEAEALLDPAETRSQVLWAMIEDTLVGLHAETLRLVSGLTVTAGG